MDDVTRITYKGWVTSVSSLKANGWIFTAKPKYRNWRDSKNSSASNDYLYLRHPETNQIGRLKLEGVCYGELDFLTDERNQRVKPPKYILERDYTEADIEPMLEAIIQVQKQRPKRRKTLPEADIIEMRFK